MNPAQVIDAKKGGGPYWHPHETTACAGESSSGEVRQRGDNLRGHSGTCFDLCELTQHSPINVRPEALAHDTMAKACRFTFYGWAILSGNIAPLFPHAWSTWGDTKQRCKAREPASHINGLFKREFCSGNRREHLLFLLISRGDSSCLVADALKLKSIEPLSAPALGAPLGTEPNQVHFACEWLANAFEPTLEEHRNASGSKPSNVLADSLIRVTGCNADLNYKGAELDDVQVTHSGHLSRKVSKRATLRVRPRLVFDAPPPHIGPKLRDKNNFASSGRSSLKSRTLVLWKQRPTVFEVRRDVSTIKVANGTSQSRLTLQDASRFEKRRLGLVLCLHDSEV